MQSYEKNHKIGGKVYKYAAAFPNKSSAESSAAWYRERGYSARIKKIPGGYVVYKRKS